MEIKKGDRFIDKEFGYVVSALDNSFNGNQTWIQVKLENTDKRYAYYAKTTELIPYSKLANAIYGEK